MTEINGSEREILTKNSATPSVQPTRNPLELADLISDLPNQAKAEFTYELIYFAAVAAADTGHEALNELLAELEDMAAVYTDPQKRRELRRSIREAARPHLPASPTE